MNIDQMDRRSIILKYIRMYMEKQRENVRIEYMMNNIKKYMRK